MVRSSLRSPGGEHSPPKGPSLPGSVSPADPGSPPDRLVPSPLRFVTCRASQALLGSSTRTMAHQEAWRAAATILCYHANRLSEDRQQWLLDTLKVASKYTDKNVLRGPGPPPLINLTSLKPVGPWLRPVDVEDKQSGSKQVLGS